MGSAIDHPTAGRRDPPPAMMEAYLAKDEQALGQMLGVLFCIHGYLHSDIKDECVWDDYLDDFCAVVMRVYENGEVSERLDRIAPNWPTAKHLSWEWYQDWPHSCGDADAWAFRHDELEEPKALRFFADMAGIAKPIQAIDGPQKLVQIVGDLELSVEPDGSISSRRAKHTYPQDIEVRVFDDSMTVSLLNDKSLVHEFHLREGGELGWDPDLPEPDWALQALAMYYLMKQQ